MYKPVQRNWLRFSQNLKKTVHVLRVNETKVTLRKAVIDNAFALESEKE